MTRSSQCPLVAAALVTLAIGAFETLNASFVGDDFIQLGVLEGVSPVTAAGRFSLYSFADGHPAHVDAVKRAGAFPWFTEPHFKLKFFRPISSALLALDHRVFGLHPSGYRAHGVLWLLLLVISLGLVLRRVLPGPQGVLALVIFSLSAIHGVLYWTATRHIVIAGALGTVALASHLRWREGGWPPGRSLALAALAGALAASEAALAVIAYLIAYEALAAPGSPGDRCRAAAPALVLTGLYVVAYQFFEFGSAATGGYVDPLHEPLRFLAELPARLAVLLGALVLGGNADVWVLRPDLRLTMVAAGGAAVLLGTVALRTAWVQVTPRERHTIAWLGAGSVAGAVAFAGTPIGSRCLVIPFIGGSAVIAVVIHRWWTDWRGRRGLAWRLLGALAAVLAAVHLALGPVERVASPLALRAMMNERLARAMRQAEIEPAGLEQRMLIILNAPDLVVGLHAYFYRELYRLPMPASWRVLSLARADNSFLRTHANVLEMTLAGGEIEAPNLRVGDVMDVGDMRATVLDVGRRGPVRVRFWFDRSLDDPSILLLGWQRGALRRVKPPPVGETLALDRD